MVVAAASTVGNGATPAGDPQGGRYHLLLGRRDWASCDELADGFDSPLSFDPATHWVESAFEFDEPSGSLRLAHRDLLGRRSITDSPRRVDERRGAGRDRYGTWYWIGADGREIRRRGPSATASTRWWSLDDVTTACPPDGVGFVPVATPIAPRPDDRLQGLAVTLGHRLVVGLVDDRTGGVLVFDLHAGGPPVRMTWPGQVSVAPFDIAPASDGGALVLDRARRRLWRLDATLRLRADVTAGAPPLFGPVDTGDPTSPRGCSEPTIEPSAIVFSGAGDEAVIDPIAVTDSPFGPIVLDRPPAGPSALVFCDARSSSGVAARLSLTVEALDPTRPDLPAFTHEVVGHDLAWCDGSTGLPLDGPAVYVADAATGVTEAYAVVAEPLTLVHRSEELPMRAWDAKAIVEAGGDVFYDAVDRWVPLEPFGMCSLVRSGTFVTPIGVDRVPGAPFDAALPGCVWHRLFVDAHVPDGCAIEVAARAADDAELLVRLPFVAQPTPYRRGRGSEMPWHDPWEDVPVRPPSGQAATFELLFQGVVGRYVQLRVTLVGNGRATPALRALRAWYPRFSYVDAYLPDVYHEDDADRFLERMLAIFEGVLTEHEARIEHTWMLADPRTTPTDALDWLASWVGLHLEPAWTPERKRFLIQHVDRMYRIRGTLAGLRALLRVYLGCRLEPDVVFDAVPRSDDPARIVDHVDRDRFRVVIPTLLDDGQAAMVAQIVDAARPAHAGYEIRVATGLLVVGEAVLGVDTVLGSGSRFEPIVLGMTALGAGVLGADHPFDVTDRLVADRDRLGNYPPL